MYKIFFILAINCNFFSYALDDDPSLPEALKPFSTSEFVALINLNAQYTREDLSRPADQETIQSLDQASRFYKEEKIKEAKNILISIKESPEASFNLGKICASQEPEKSYGFYLYAAQKGMPDAMHCVAAYNWDLYMKDKQANTQVLLLAMAWSYHAASLGIKAAEQLFLNAYESYNKILPTIVSWSDSEDSANEDSENDPPSSESSSDEESGD